MKATIIVGNYWNESITMNFVPLKCSNTTMNHDHVHPYRNILFT